MTLRARTLECLSVLGLIIVFATPAFAQGRPCPTVTSRTQQLRAEVAEYISSQTWTDFRTGVGITTGDSSHLAIVTADSLCEALTAANDSISGIVSTNALMVIQFQSFFAVASPDRANYPIYIFDNTRRRLAAIRFPD
jgi:hypothetical protein